MSRYRAFISFLILLDCYTDSTSAGAITTARGKIKNAVTLIQAWVDTTVSDSQKCVSSIKALADVLGIMDCVSKMNRDLRTIPRAAIADAVTAIPAAVGDIVDAVDDSIKKFTEQITKIEIELLKCFPRAINHGDEDNPQRVETDRLRECINTSAEELKTTVKDVVADLEMAVL